MNKASKIFAFIGLSTLAVVSLWAVWDFLGIGYGKAFIWTASALNSRTVQRRCIQLEGWAVMGIPIHVNPKEVDISYCAEEGENVMPIMFLTPDEMPEGCREENYRIICKDEQPLFIDMMKDPNK